MADAPMYRQVVVLDFESFYDADYTLTKMTTAQYIRDPRFEIIGVAIAAHYNDWKPEWHSAKRHSDLATKLRALPIDWENAIVVAHNCMFDGAILEWVLGIRAKTYLCTMMMARQHVVPYSHRTNLAHLARHMDLPKKGNEVLSAKGMHYDDFDEFSMRRYGKYCERDVEICRLILRALLPDILIKDRITLSFTLLKFIRPILLLDVPVLKRLAVKEAEDKAALLLECGVEDPKELGSNQKFAALLAAKGVDVPTKISPTTGKEAYAFAKTDEGFKELQRHPDRKVRGLVEARLGVKSTLMETRIERFIKLSEFDTSLPWPLLWFGAHTGRYSGFDKLNMQNLPARNDTSLRDAVVAPRGHVIVAGDLSQIEARITAFIADEVELVKTFAEGEDVYTTFATTIYHAPMDEIAKAQRFVGKTAILGLGFQCGGEKFLTMLNTAGVYDFDLAGAKGIVSTYRETFRNIKKLWAKGQRIVEALYRLSQVKRGDGAVWVSEIPGVVVYRDRIQLMGERMLYYPQMEMEPGEDGDFDRYSYMNNKGNRVALYGGKLIENIVQALAQLVIRDVELRVASSAKMVAAGQLHDELIYVCREEFAEELRDILEWAMTAKPTWTKMWTGDCGELPLACEIGIGRTYAQVK